MLQGECCVVDIFYTTSLLWLGTFIVARWSTMLFKECVAVNCIPFWDHNVSTWAVFSVTNHLIPKWCKLMIHPNHKDIFQVWVLLGTKSCYWIGHHLTCAFQTSSLLNSTFTQGSILLPVVSNFCLWILEIRNRNVQGQVNRHLSKTCDLKCKTCFKHFSIWKIPLTSKEIPHNI